MRLNIMRQPTKSWRNGGLNHIESGLKRPESYKWTSLWKNGGFTRKDVILVI